MLLDILYNFIDRITPWFYAHGARIIVILLGAYLLRRFAGVIVEKIMRKAVVSDNFLTPEAEVKREDTLIRVFNGAIKFIIWAGVILMILSEMGVNIGPLLAGAGIIGIALGFGAQYIVRDFITGLFIIFENQYRVGDVIKIGEISGMVEDINLRMTVVRDIDGAVHHIPNGEISVASNLTKQFARVNLKIGVSYDSDIEKVTKVVNMVGQELANDIKWKDSINKAPEFIRVDDFADSAVIIMIQGEVKPLQQWAVAGELRKRIKIAFDKENIEIPFPQRVIHQARK
ncbi:MAG: mechanosensitive ion channel family protein [bacterium]